MKPTKAYNDFSLRFLEAIERLNLTDYQVWRDLPNLSKATMSKIRNGVCGVSMKNLSEFCNFYKVNAHYIVTGDGEMLLPRNSDSGQNEGKEGDTNDNGIKPLSMRFISAVEALNLNGYRLKKEGIAPSDSTLSNIKKGKQSPSAKTIDALCKKYNVNKEWLYIGTGNMMLENEEVEIQEENKENKENNHNNNNEILISALDIIYKQRESIDFILKDSRLILSQIMEVKDILLKEKAS